MDRAIKVLHKPIISQLTSVLSIKIGQPCLYHCEPVWRWKPAPFCDFDLWMILAGRGMVTCAGSDHVLRAGAGFIFQPGDCIEATHDFENPLVVFACHFFRAEPRRKTCRFLAPLFHYTVSDIDFLGRCAEKAAHAYEQGPSGRQLAAAFVAQFVAQGLLLSERRKPIHPADEKLADLALEIRSRPGAEWDAPSMAKRCALSPAQFNRRFRQTFGSSARQYVLRERIDRAATLLRETELSIKEIAEALGYRDVFYFHRQFRQMLGQTPLGMRLLKKGRE
jgi:AraC-like DNA-binding protein